MAFEFTILDWIDKLHSPIMDKLMIGITTLGDNGYIWIAIGIILLFFKNYRKIGIMVLAALLIDLLVVNITIKPLIQRERPYTVKDMEILIAALHDYSFPSGHSAASFAAAAAIFYNNRIMGIAAIILGSLIAFSRMYLYVHYPTDILAGIIIGIFCGVLSVVVCNIVIKTYNRRK